MATAVTPEAVEKVVFDALPQFGAEPSEITPRGDVRGSRRRLARPRRALADHRGRVRRPAQGRRRRQDQDRRRRRRHGGEPGRMKREIVVTGIGAVTPLGVGARTLHERWIAGTSGIEDGEGACTEFDPTEYLSVKEVRRADRFTQFALVASDEALKEAGWDGEAPPYDADADRLHRRHRHRRDRHADPQPPGAARAGREEGLAALDPADDGQRGRRRGQHAPQAARPVVRAGLGLRRRRARDRRGDRADRVRRAPTPSSPAAPRRRSCRSRAPPSARWTRCRTSASRARSTSAATAS